jgi:transcriptional regulator with XRE-family HTH domain
MAVSSTLKHAPGSVGVLLREWRARRRLSQLDLALEAGVSQRHVSFLESGRAAPSRDMVEMLAAALDLPLRERNALLLAAGFAPAYAERQLADPAMQPALAAVRRVLAAYEPNPALAVDRQWRMVMANDAVGPLLTLVGDPSLAAGSYNVVRLALHPRGLAPHILNYDAWRDHILHRLGQQIQASGDPYVIELRHEVAAYPRPETAHPASKPEALDPIAIPLQIRVGDAVLSFLSTLTMFGTPMEVTLSELAIEAFLPADETTAQMMAALATQRAGAK